VGLKLGTIDEVEQVRHDLISGPNHNTVMTKRKEVDVPGAEGENGLEGVVDGRK
jgi:hypothetical protein